MFTQEQNQIVIKVLGYYTFNNNGVTTTKPRTKAEIVAVKVQHKDGSEGAIPQIYIVDFQALPENC